MKKVVLGLVSCVLFSAVAIADMQVFSVGEIAVMQQNANGTYDVVCMNGNRENINDLDLELNNVCPHKTTSKPSGILSLQRREDGSFDVVCRDLKKLVATAADILAGKACVQSPPPIVLEDGLYADSSRQFCDQDIKTGYSDSVLTKVSVRFVGGCSGGVELTCKDNFCTGFTSGYTFTLKPLALKSYELERLEDKRKATFVKK